MDDSVAGARRSSRRPMSGRHRGLRLWAERSLVEEFDRRNAETRQRSQFMGESSRSDHAANSFTEELFQIRRGEDGRGGPIAEGVGANDPLENIAHESSDGHARR